LRRCKFFRHRRYAVSGCSFELNSIKLSHAKYPSSKKKQEK
jgi:hypothetical protein